MDFVATSQGSLGPQNFITADRSARTIPQKLGANGMYLDGMCHPRKVGNSYMTRHL